MGTLETSLSSKMGGGLDDIETELGRFDMLVDDNERASHPAMIADEIKIATLVRSLPPALRAHVELNQNTSNTWTEVTNRRCVKT